MGTMNGCITNLHKVSKCLLADGTTKAAVHSMNPYVIF